MKLVNLFFLSAFFVTSLTLRAQTTKQLYILGVHMGLASFHASVAVGEKNNLEAMKQAIYVSGTSVKDALSMVRQINSVASYHPFLEVDALQNLYQAYFSSIDQNDIEYARVVVKNDYSGIIALREGYTAQLSKYNGMSNQVHAYVMGINIAIAEGQATVGEAARQIVYASLVNAKTEAQALNLDLGPLNECISLINATTPIAEIYTKIVSMRSTYQSSL